MMRQDDQMMMCWVMIHGAGQGRAGEAFMQ